MSGRWRAWFGRLAPDGLKHALFARRMRREHGLQVSDEATRVVSGSRFGRGSRLRTPTYFVHSRLGDRSYVEAHCRVSHCRIGKFSAIGPGCHIGLVEHPSRDFVSSHPIFYRADPARGFDFADREHRVEVMETVIGHDVWIGAGAIVRGGVSIGDGAIVGAGAVVTRDVEPYAVVAGVPATVLRFRFDPATIELLSKARWWDWDEEELRRHHLRFHDVAQFEEYLRQREGRASRKG